MVKTLHGTEFEYTHKVLFSNGDIVSDYGNITLSEVISSIERMTNSPFKGKVFVTSDTHLSHRFVSQLRGYDEENGGVEKHNSDLIEAWNSVVSPEDIVVHLGDVTIGSTSPLSLLNDANGRKILLPGNHDKCWSREGSVKGVDKFLEVFDAIITKGSCWLNDEHEVVMSHIPPIVSEHDERDPRYVDLVIEPGDKRVIHGHVHSRWHVRESMVNVGVDFSPAPVLLDDALAMSLSGAGAESPLSIREVCHIG